MIRIALKSQSFQASIQCSAMIGPPAKSHLNGVSLAGRWCPANSGIWILPPFIKLKQKGCQSWTTSDKPFWIRACTTYRKQGAMGSGLHVKNGQDPETSVHLLITFIFRWCTYLPPVLLYGLEVVFPKSTLVEKLEMTYYRSHWTT